MKKLLLILLCLPLIGFGQQTYVPDDNFEAWIEINYPLANNGMVNDNYVLTNGININSNPNFDIYLTINQNNNVGPIFDLTGIEDFYTNKQLLLMTF